MMRKEELSPEIQHLDNRGEESSNEEIKRIPRVFRLKGPTGCPREGMEMRLTQRHVIMKFHWEQRENPT